MELENHKFSTRRIIVLVAIAMAVAAIVYVAVQLCKGYKIFTLNNQISTNERTSDKVIEEWLETDKKFDVDGFMTRYKTEDLSIDSSLDGHEIPATYIYADGNDRSDHTVIMVHGLLGNRISNFPMAEMFLSLGCNVITYDQRSSGKNTAPHNTFGYLESYDLVDYAAYAAGLMHEDNMLGVWGQSMGAATVENAMDDEYFAANVDFVVLDCPLGDMSDSLFARGISGAFADYLFKSRVGFSFRDQSVYRQIENTKIPVLIVSSKADDRIPYETSQRIFDAMKNNKKAMFTVEDSRHSDVYFDHSPEYKKAVERFIGANVSQNTGSEPGDN